MADRIEDGGPAFPVVESMEPGDFGKQVVYSTIGITVRDYFAAKAMAALLIDPERADQSREECARLSYLMADSMLAARAQSRKDGEA